MESLSLQIPVPLQDADVGYWHSRPSEILLGEKKGHGRANHMALGLRRCTRDSVHRCRETFKSRW